MGIENRYNRRDAVVGVTWKKIRGGWEGVGEDPCGRTVAGYKIQWIASVTTTRVQREEMCVVRL